MPANLQPILSYATETSASSWFTALPVKEHGFALHKRAFAYVMGGIPPSVCARSKNFTVEYAMNCPPSGFLTIQHNEQCAFTTSLLSELCYVVSVEPQIAHPYSGDFSTFFG